MADAKKADPKRKYIKGFIYADLWRDFRSTLVKKGMDVTEGLEEAIAEWLTVND